jgi:IPT/TIG domain-containing protein
MFASSFSRCLAVSLPLFGIVACSGSTPVSPAPPSSVEPLAITGISPLAGPAVGGTPLTISGTGFMTGATVTMDGKPALVRSVGSRSISALTPSAPGEGAVDVVVLNPDGRSARLPGGFTYVVFAQPMISAVSASPGSTRGGAAFTISGTGFQASARVAFGGASVSASLFRGELIGTTPAHAAGTVDVTVTNPDGHAHTLAAAYTYVDPSALDFNGTWEGYGSEGETFLTFTVRDNSLIEIKCGSSAGAPPTRTFLPTPPVPITDGAFSFSAGADTVTGRILTQTSSQGTVSVGACFAGHVLWLASKR